jgi:hypothetical protein
MMAFVDTHTQNKDDRKTQAEMVGGSTGRMKKREEWRQIVQEAKAHPEL